ncbi:hypothetical protein ACFQBN_44990 [Cohnella cellulosilytica]
MILFCSGCSTASLMTWTNEKGIIYDALAPAAAELAQLYIDLDINYNLSYADSAAGDFCLDGPRSSG